MNEAYRVGEPSALVSHLQGAYIRLLGIPEIGLRLRALYFSQALKHLPPNPARVLDAGSGIGAYALLLARRYPSATVIGCDVDEGKTSFCAGLVDEHGLKNVQFVSADVTDLDSLGEPFDVIVCVDVLEHVSDYERALQCFWHMLKPDGILYLHTPQRYQRRIFSRFKTWQHEDHVREGFKPGDLASDLERVGFAVVELRQTFGVFGKLAWELNHLTLKWNAGLAGLAFPGLYMLARLDAAGRNEEGLGVSLTARKVPVGRGEGLTE